jgi:hypothetical protein
VQLAKSDLKDKPKIEAGYFFAHHQRLPIGSGTIESAAKQTKYRVSAVGMRWPRPGLENFLALHAAL